MKQIFIDTNILIYCALQTKEGHDSRLISKLAHLLQEEQAGLILPEIIELEYQRKTNEVFEQVRKSISNLQKALEKVEFPCYLAQEKEKILKNMRQLIADRERNKTEVSSAINILFGLKNVEKIPLTPEISLDAYRRAARGKKPFNLKNTFQGINADCIIIESLRQYYRSHGANMV